MFTNKNKYSNFTAVSTDSKPVDNMQILQDQLNILNESLGKMLSKSQAIDLQQITLEFKKKSTSSPTDLIKNTEDGTNFLIANFPYHWPSDVKDKFSKWINQNRTLVGLKTIILPTGPKAKSSSNLTNMLFIGGGIIALILTIVFLTMSKPKMNSLTAFGRRVARISGRR
jgi:hypothetical protein